MDENRLNKLQQSFGIIGESEKIKEIIETIDQVAAADITVLIAGESGTGKELIADAIHKQSRRKHQPFVKVNCGAIPAGILESELFGHVKGSFTGAIEDRKGYFETANNGTIFLDEIGEMPMETQVKLLRVLESGEFLPVGGSHGKKVDVRIIAASNKDLAEEIEREKFRKDLYYRLKTITITAPALRHHSEDIPLLIEHFALDFANRNNIPFKGFSPSAIHLMENYRWPGNIRELKNFVESMIVLEKGEVINSARVARRLGVEKRPVSSNLPVRVSKSVDQAERELILQQVLLMRRDIADIKDALSGKSAGVLLDLPPKTRELQKIIAPPIRDEETIESEPEPEAVQDYTVNPNKLGEVSLAEVERELIEKTLKKFHHKKRQTANALKISERTLYRKIKEYGL
ncbi:MAG: sigma-54-dependent Fis family transcriptional regulator [Candidatus Neomarinimicrobiota bacterium]|nr:MAG: sigma-54-dependent Fis family transcriptional regulator [Candidatus Neomarinimicrobiota bacterium]